MMSNKDIEDLERQLEQIRGQNQPDRGPSDLEQRIEDLLKINLAHQNLNADLRGDIKYLQDRVNFYQIQVEQLKKENQKLRDMGKDFIDGHRNKGNI